MSALDAILGKLRADGVELELRGETNYEGFYVTPFNDANGNPAGWTFAIPPATDPLSNTFFVDVGTSVDLGNDGSIARPFSNLSAGVTALPPGGGSAVLFLTPGDYSGVGALVVANAFAGTLAIRGLGAPAVTTTVPKITGGATCGLSLENVGSFLAAPGIAVESFGALTLRNCDLYQWNGDARGSSTIDLQDTRVRNLIGLGDGAPLTARDSFIAGDITTRGTLVTLRDCSFSGNTTITFGASPGSVDIDAASYAAAKAAGTLTIVNGTLVAPDASYVYTSGTGSHTKPAGGWSRVFVYVISGGGGGASGRKRAVGAIGCGGGGGGGGGISFAVYDYATFPASVTYLVGAGGAGAARQTVNSTDGIDGTVGGNSSVVSPSGQMLLAEGGNPGLKGTASSGAGGAGGAGMISGKDGASASTIGGQSGGAPTAAVNSVALACTGGGAGGGITAAEVAAAAVLGGLQYAGLRTAYQGTVGNSTGTDAVAPLAQPSFTQGGIGGPSGAASVTTRGTDGAVGAKYGGGGGGGGAGTNAQASSGAGKAGGDGVVAFFYV